MSSHLHNLYSRFFFGGCASPATTPNFVPGCSIVAIAASRSIALLEPFGASLALSPPSPAMLQPLPSKLMNIEMRDRELSK
jgi:hypothetical protein